MPKESERIRKRRSEVTFNDGYIDTRRNKYTDDLNTLYDSVKQGIETDPKTPYSCVCELHGTVICTETKAIGMSILSDATNWCDDCRAIANEPEPDTKKIWHLVTMDHYISGPYTLDDAKHQARNSTFDKRKVGGFVKSGKSYYHTVYRGYDGVIWPSYNLVTTEDLASWPAAQFEYEASKDDE